MVWKLEWVHSDDCVPIERITVCELGEIVAPAEVDNVGLKLSTTRTAFSIWEVGSIRERIPRAQKS